MRATPAEGWRTSTSGWARRAGTSFISIGGLWDLAYRPNGSKQTGLNKAAGTQTWPLPEYDRRLRELVRRLKQTGARLAWASTTPVPEGEPGRFKGKEVRYNEAARRIMQENGIPINDLYEHMLPKAGVLAMKPGDVPCSEDGYMYLARRGAASIEKQIDSIGTPHGYQYFKLRGGLRNSLLRFSAGGSARVVFLGGSITAMRGWRGMFCEYLQGRFPRTSIDRVNAGIPPQARHPAPFV